MAKFCIGNCRNKQTTLWVINPNTAETRPLITEMEGAREGTSFFSPLLLADGRLIVSADPKVESQNELWIVDPKTQSFEQLTSHEVNTQLVFDWPSFTYLVGSEIKVVFRSNRTRKHRNLKQLWEVDLRTKKIQHFSLSSDPREDNSVEVLSANVLGNNTLLVHAKFNNDETHRPWIFYTGTRQREAGGAFGKATESIR